MTLHLSLCFSILVIIAPAASLAGSVGTLTLDALSFASFGDRETIPLPDDSRIKFRFEDARADGSASFTIEPTDVEIPDIEFATGKTLRYAIASTASGTMVPTAEGRRIQFTAVVRATLIDEGVGSVTYDYTIPFTTETTAASNLPGDESLSVYGMRLVDGVWYGQIVGATTNRKNAFPEPGTAIYTVLSGTFDQVP